MSERRTVKQQVISGVLIAGAWLLGMAWLGLVFGGMIELGVGTEGGFSSGSRPSHIFGLLLVATAAAIFIATANRWKRYFPGIMLASTAASWLEFQNGHALNSPSVLIPRWIALVQLLVIVGVTALSFTFKKRPLNILDRVALLAFAASIYPGGDEVWHRKMPLALIVGGACVLAAWAYDRARHRPQHGSPHADHVPAD